MRQGGTNAIHYHRRDPHARIRGWGLPAQFPSTRRVAGVAMSCSPRSARRSGITPGRCCAASRVGEDPPPLYRELHAVADAAFDAVAARAAATARCPPR